MLWSNYDLDFWNSSYHYTQLLRCCRSPSSIHDYAIYWTPLTWAAEPGGRVPPENCGVGQGGTLLGEKTSSFS